MMSSAILLGLLVHSLDGLGLSASATDASVQVLAVFQSVHDSLGNLLRKLVEDLLGVEGA